MVARPAYQPPPAFGKYRIGELLGKGGMASVFRGEDTLLERPVAVKFLRQDIARSSSAQQRFLREARLVAKLAHPNVVAVFDFGMLDDGTYYQVSELVAGKTLREVLRAGALEPMQALRYARQLALGLASAHDIGVIHRDLKPSNVMVVPDKTAPDGCRLKILDFGIAKQLDAEHGDDDTRTGVAIGTPGYMSPEQSGGAEVGPASDVYSLGVVLFAMVCGRTPFDAADTELLLSAHRYDAPPPPSRFVACSPAIDAVVARCLAKDPAARPQTMPQVIALLDGVLETGDRAASPAAAAADPVRDDPATARVAAAGPRLVRHAYEPVTASAVQTVSTASTTVSRAPSRRRLRAMVGAAGLAAVAVIVVVAKCAASEPGPTTASGAASPAASDPTTALGTASASGTAPASGTASAPTTAAGSTAASGTAPAPTTASGTATASGAAPAPTTASGPATASGATAASGAAPAPTAGSGTAPAASRASNGASNPTTASGAAPTSHGKAGAAAHGHPPHAAASAAPHPASAGKPDKPVEVGKPGKPAEAAKPDPPKGDPTAPRPYEQVRL